MSEDDRAAAPGTDPTGTGADPLEELRVELDAVLDRPVEERVEVFERTQRVVAAELRALEQG